ncbi:MAG: carbohydrate binding domain-containing protein, partial [Acidobacteriota bacterium]
MVAGRIRGLLSGFSVAGIWLFIPMVLMAADPWHYPLYVSGGDYWRQRIGVEVRNPINRSLNGKPVSIQVGTGSGQVDLSGAEARSIRLVDATTGRELLFDVTGPSGTSVRSGPIPAGSSLTLPIECPPFGTKHYWIYFDNPEAWLVPDYLRPPGLLNGGVEEGIGHTPTWWSHDGGDPHHRASWVEESPHSGRKCLKLQVTPGAANSWISTRQTSIPIEGGRTYVLTGWVRAEDVSVDSQTGWYLHVATPGNPMAINRGLSAGGGSYGWTNVSVTFTTPVDAISASVGTMLWGNGTAWFDDVSLEMVGTEAPHDLEITATASESLELSHLGETQDWFDDDPTDELGWDYRVPLHFINLGQQSKQVSGSVSLRRFAYRPEVNPDSYRIVEGTRVIPSFAMADEIIFSAAVPANSRKTYYLYFSSDQRISAAAQSPDEFPYDAGNLVANPGFESWSGNRASNWVFQAPTPSTTYGPTSPGRFGQYSARFTVPHSDSAIVGWPGWRQDVPVVAGNTYRFGAWIKLDDVRGSVRAHAHVRDAAGNLVGTNPYLSIGSGLSGTTGWTQLIGTFTIPQGATTFQIHLTMNGTGTLSHDGVLVVGNVSHPVQGPIEVRDSAGEVQVWSIPAVIKVFQDDPPLFEPAPPMVSAARGEVEPLQLVVRSKRSREGVRIEIDSPQRGSGQFLQLIETSIVDYVPVAHTSDYYSVSGQKTWERIVITGRPGTEGVLPSDIGQGSDGWVGYWPDPLIPGSQFNLWAGRSQPVWLTIRVPEDAIPGNYVGRVRFVDGEESLAEIPFTVHVWDFNLPAERHLGAIYDVRTDSRFQIPGQSNQVSYSKLLEMMADHRVAPDRVLPDPIFSYRDGTVTADYSEFDPAASYLLDTLGLPFLYTPSIFYCFGWGNLPVQFLGENPYRGSWPYAGVNRAELSPSYKQAYQAVLRDFWDHLEQKGWQDRFVLYISDEPHYRTNGVIEQMQALCDMIHEVDPRIPIYSSVWDHVPAWDGYLDVWGIGQFGSVPTSKMRELTARGDRLWFTTDGQMCLDTPYNAIERLLPHIAFHYDVEAYEFWGIDWLSDYDPYLFG